MFYRDKSSLDGLTSSCKDCRKAYYQNNKTKILERMKVKVNKNKRKTYLEQNREKILEQRREYNKRPENMEKRRGYNRVNKERISERQKLRRELTKHSVNEWASRRRARKKASIPEFLAECAVERERIKNIYKLREIMSKATGIEHHVDHMWPLADGGPHWSGNLQVIKAEDNLRKGSRVCDKLKRSISESLMSEKLDREA